MTIGIKELEIQRYDQSHLLNILGFDLQRIFLYRLHHTEQISLNLQVVFFVRILQSLGVESHQRCNFLEVVSDGCPGDPIVEDLFLLRKDLTAEIQVKGNRFKGSNVDMYAQFVLDKGLVGVKSFGIVVFMGRFELFYDFLHNILRFAFSLHEG